MVRSQSLTRTVNSLPVAGARTDQVYVASELSGWTGATRPQPLVIVHGAGYRTQHLTNDPNFPNYCRMTRELAKHFTVYVSDMGGDWWGSPDHVSRIGDAKTYLEANWGTSGPVTLVGFSMGGLAALNYAKANPTLVRAVCTIFPVISLNRFRTDTPGALTQIDTCYSGGYSDASYGANHNPALWASSLTSSVPVRIHYSDADSTIPADTITTFAANRPSTQVEMVGHNGHTDATIGDALASIVQFCRVPS